MTANSQSTRIALACPSLEAGGAQRVIAQLANHWSARHEQVSLITLSSSESDFFQLESSVTRIPLDLVGESGNPVAAVWHNRERIRVLRACLTDADPHILVSFVDQMNVLSLLAARPLQLPVIVAERTDPRQHPLGAPWKMLRKFTYPWARKVVTQTESVERHLQTTIRGCQTQVIPNGVPALDVGVRSPSKRVVAVGRLSREKGFDRLIDAFAQTATRCPNWQLRIFGDGPEREALKRQAEELVAGKVEFCGWTKDVSSALAEAAVFALPSRYEGFPNVLLEAMAMGLAVVCFDCPSGPGEIVQHQHNGWLVEDGDLDTFTEGLLALMTNGDLRERLGEEARLVQDRFSMQRFFESWDRLIREHTESPDG